MIALKNILNIICTEAFEDGGIPEVPDHKHGARENYSAAKRDARRYVEHDRSTRTGELSDLKYNLELVEDKDGTLHWYE